MLKLLKKLDKFDLILIGWIILIIVVNIIF